MLEIQVPYKEGDVVTLKLSSGEELVTKLVKENKDTLTVQMPLTLVATEQGMSLAPYLFTITPDTKLDIRLNNVITVVKSAEDTAKGYTSQTSGLIT